MSEQSTGSNASTPNSPTQNIRDVASEAFTKASDIARDTGAQAKRAAVDTAASVTQNVKDVLDRQLDTGANVAGQFASSIRVAADDLNREAPMLASLVHGFANTVDTYASGLQHQTVDQLARGAADFTRRQPALVFGLAALAGFFVFRALKSSQTVVAPPIQPMQAADSLGLHHG